MPRKRSYAVLSGRVEGVILDIPDVGVVEVLGRYAGLSAVANAGG